ncbi:MAG: hypothetical protein M1436_02960 [Acidobacteria bacterium]|nr:hypothetical protein [Acidobacteriota bacterium]
MPDGSAAAPVKIPGEAFSGESSRREISDRLHVGEIVFLVGDLVLWTVLLAVGLFIASEPYRNALLAKQPRFVDYAFVWFMAFLSYTFTNLAILCSIASIAGAGARHVETQLAGGQPITNLRALYTSAAVRGFFVYLIALSGLMFLAEGLFANIAKSADAYMRLAGGISALSFMLGFNPEMFARFLERIARLLEDQGSRTKA